MQNLAIKDTALSASTWYNNDYAAFQARLHYNLGADRYYGWLSGTTDTKQWLQITFTQWNMVTGIATQGRGNANQFVKSYTLSYSYDTVFFDPYKENSRTKVRKC